MAAFVIRGILNKSSLIVASVLLLGATVNRTQADETETLEGVLEKHRLATFADVGKYVDSHPDAKDIDEAYFFLFRESLQHDMEDQASPYAESYLKREHQDDAMSNLAQQVRCLGLAEQGHLDEAVVVFESLLAHARPQLADPMLGVGYSLASKARAARNAGISRDVYERLSAAFPFNERVTNITQLGLLKHDLLNKPAPKLGAPDMQGQQLDWQQYRGKVVLVDFWATWCVTCLEEMTNLKKIYGDLHDQGFEIIGVNRDEDEEQVKKFLASAGMPWQQILDGVEQFNLEERFDAKMLPATYLVDRKGIVVQFDVTGGELRQQVEQLLKKK